MANFRFDVMLYYIFHYIHIFYVGTSYNKIKIKGELELEYEYKTYYIKWNGCHALNKPTKHC